MNKQNEAENILSKAQNLSALFSSVVSVPVRLVPFVTNEKNFFCCDFCRILARTESLQDCRTLLQCHGKTAQSLGGGHAFFCQLGTVCFVTPILYRSKPIAVALAGPFSLNLTRIQAVNNVSEQTSLSAAEKDKILKYIATLPQLTPVKLNRTFLLLTALFHQTDNALLPYNYIAQTETDLLAAQNSHDLSAAKHSVQAGLSAMFTLLSENISSLRNHCLQFALMLCSFLSNSASEDFCIQRKYASLLQQLYTCADVSSLKHCMSLTEKLFFQSLTEKDGKQSYNEAIHQAIKYIQQNYVAKITLTSAAAHVFLSPAYFSRKFKEETGKNFNQYLNEIRVEKAKQLLRETNFSLSKVALSTGFENQSYFAKVFHHLTGTTPNSYRLIEHTF